MNVAWHKEMRIQFREGMVSSSVMETVIALLSRVNK